MENLKEILSYGGMSAIFIAIIISLISLIIATNRESKRLDEAKNVKNPKKEIEDGELIHS